MLSISDRKYVGIFGPLVWLLGNGVKFKVEFFERKPHFLFTLLGDRTSDILTIGICRYDYKSSFNSLDFHPLSSYYIQHYKLLLHWKKNQKKRAVRRTKSSKKISVITWVLHFHQNLLSCEYLSAKCTVTFRNLFAAFVHRAHINFAVAKLLAFIDTACWQWSFCRPSSANSCFAQAGHHFFADNRAKMESLEDAARKLHRRQRTRPGLTCSFRNFEIPIGRSFHCKVS